MSSASQVDNYSLDAQERDLQEFCARHEVEIAGVYQDAGISGATIEDRPAVRELIRDAQVGRFNLVLIARVDRFTRADPWDLYPLVKGLMDLNVKLQSITETFDLADDNGQLIFSILANFAARERKLILLRTLGGKKDRAREGGFTGGKIPFGYKVNAATGHYISDDTIWWQDLTKADVVRLIFRHYLDGMSAKDIMEWFIQSGVPAPQTLWNSATIANMLRNPVYSGTFVWNKRSHSKGKRSKTHRESDWIALPNAHPALVDEETWNRCLLQRQSNQRGGRPAEATRLLDRLMACPRCGATLTPRHDPRSGTFYYVCASRYNTARLRDGTACLDAPRWDGDALTSLVWQHVTDTILSGRLLDLTKNQHGDQNVQIRQAGDEIAKITKQLKEVDRQETQLLDLILADRFSAAVLDKKQTAIEKERSRLRAMLQEAEGRQRRAKASNFTIKDLRMLQRELKQVLREEATLKERRSFLEFWLGDRIIVRDNGVVEIIFNKPEPASESQNKPMILPRRAP